MPPATGVVPSSHCGHRGTYRSRFDAPVTFRVDRAALAVAAKNLNLPISEHNHELHLPDHRYLGPSATPLASPDHYARSLRDVVPDARELVALDSEMNRFLPLFPQVTLCLYDLERFGGDSVVDLLRTHPKSARPSRSLLGTGTSGDYREPHRPAQKRHTPQR